MFNPTINSFLTCPIAPIQGSNQPEETDVTIVSRYIGSNGYTVSIEASSIFYKIKAKIISPNGGNLEITVENICNGLDSRPLTVEQIMGMIHNGPHAFKAIYLPETNKVYIWPHMKAAGEGNFFMNNKALNPFVGTKIARLGETLRNPNFKIPGTSKTVAKVGGFGPGKDNRAFVSHDRTVTSISTSSRRTGIPDYTWRQ